VWTLNNYLPFGGKRSIPTHPIHCQTRGISWDAVQLVGLCQPSIYLTQCLDYHFGFTEATAKILVNIGWWLCLTDQGLWEHPLQHVEDTIYLSRGCLLYSANKYDKEALCQEIWPFTGASVAIHNLCLSGYSLESARHFCM